MNNNFQEVSHISCIQLVYDAFAIAKDPNPAAAAMLSKRIDIHSGYTSHMQNAFIAANVKVIQSKLGWKKVKRH